MATAVSTQLSALTGSNTVQQMMSDVNSLKTLSALATDAAGSGDFVPTSGGTFTGNLGIEVNGATTLTLARTNGVSNFAEIRVGGALSEQLTIKSNESSQSGGFTAFDVGGSEHVRIKDNGRVGIGTINPSAKIHVDAPNTTTPSLTFGASAGQIFQNANSELAIGLSASSPYPLYMQGRKIENAARDISLQPLGGNVGIGVASPVEKLDVNGNLRLSGASTAGRTIEVGTGRTDSGYAFIDLVGDTTYTDYGVRLIRMNTGANADSRIMHRGTGALTLLTQESAPITFRTTNTERMRVAETGDITFKQGVVNLESASGNPAQMNFYCETGNAHYTRIQSSPHASYSGNVVLTLPTTSGTLATTASVATTGKSIAMAIVFG